MTVNYGRNVGVFACRKTGIDKSVVRIGQCVVIVYLPAIRIDRGEGISQEGLRDDIKGFGRCEYLSELIRIRSVTRSLNCFYLCVSVDKKWVFLKSQFKCLCLYIY